jgi:hypothetical protein
VDAELQLFSLEVKAPDAILIDPLSMGIGRSTFSG